MRQLILTVGDITVEEELYKGDFIGGKIIATNKKTSETFTKNWTRNHKGRSNRLAIMTEAISALAPKAKETED